MTYFNYLLKRSFLSLIYRRFYLYPKISRQLFGTILDFGCGIGDFLDFMPNTIGADINQDCVRYCSLKGHDAYLIKEGTVDLPSSSFDCIVLDNVIEHLDSPSIVLAEISRLLKPDGLLLIGLPGKKGFSLDPDHKVFYSEFSLNSLLAEFSFKPRSTYYSPFCSKFLDKNLSIYCTYVLYSVSYS